METINSNLSSPFPKIYSYLRTYESWFVFCWNVLFTELKKKGQHNFFNCIAWACSSSLYNHTQTCKSTERMSNWLGNWSVFTVSYFSLHIFSRIYGVTFIFGFCEIGARTTKLQWYIFIKYHLLDKFSESSLIIILCTMEDWKDNFFDQFSPELSKKDKHRSLGRNLRNGEGNFEDEREKKQSVFSWRCLAKPENISCGKI